MSKPAILLLLLCCRAFASGFSQQEPEFADKQVVLQTQLGEIVLELYPKIAPRHVAAFQKRVEEGFFQGTIFHRAIPYGIIQGGDPLSRNPADFERYGTGGLMELPSEFSELSPIRGTLSAVLVPGNPDSAGSQFFICVTDQPQLDGQYTIFGAVAEGMGVVEKISQLPVDSQQRVTRRVEIVRAYQRDRPPPQPVPFAEQSIEELASYRATIRTNLGDITLGFFPQLAPGHVRQFLRFSTLGLYDGTRFHRVVPGFVVQGGAFASRAEPVSQDFARYIKYLTGEFNDKPHVRGTLSMARTDDPNSALDSFFIVLEAQPDLDGKYTVFGTVLEGIDTVDGISQVPVQGETPIIPVVIERITVSKE